MDRQMFESAARVVITIVLTAVGVKLAPEQQAVVAAVIVGAVWGPLSLWWSKRSDVAVADEERHATVDQFRRIEAEAEARAASVPSTPKGAA